MVYLGICFFEILFKLKKAEKGYLQLKENYNNVLTKAEIKEAFNGDKLLRETKHSVKKGMIIWSLIWGLTLMAAIIIIETCTTNRGLIVWLLNKMFS